MSDHGQNSGGQGCPEEYFLNGGHVQAARAYAEKIRASEPDNPAHRTAWRRMSFMADAKVIQAQHELGAEMDAGFDSGEWSGPSHHEREFNELRELASKHGLSIDTAEHYLGFELTVELGRPA